MVLYLVFSLVLVMILVFQQRDFVAVIFNGKFSFTPSYMALNFSLPGMFHVKISRQFPKVGNFWSFGNLACCRKFQSTGNFPFSKCTY